MAVFQRFTKWLSALLNIDGIISLLQTGGWVLSIAGVYLMTLLDWYEYLPPVFKGFFILVVYTLMLVAIRLTVWTIQNFRVWLSSRVRRNIGLSISLSTEISNNLPDSMDANIWGINCVELPEGGYNVITTSRGFTKRMFNKPFVQKLKLTNHSAIPIFHARIPCHVDFGLMLDENSYRVVHQDESEIFLNGNNQLLPGESLTIFLSNSSNSKYIAILKLYGYIESNLLDTDGTARIKYTWESRTPLDIELPGGDDK